MAQPPLSIARDSAGRLAGLAELTEKQRAFAREYARNGGNTTAAGRVAGYAETNSHIHELARLPHVRDAIAYELDEFTTDLIAKGLQVFNGILADPGTGRDKQSMKVMVTKALFVRADQRVKQLAGVQPGQGAHPMTKEALGEVRAMVDDWRKAQAKVIDITPKKAG